VVEYLQRESLPVEKLTRHPYGLGLWQNHIERILAGWVDELEVPIYREREVTGFAQDDTGVNVELSDGKSLRAEYLVGCDGGRSLVRRTAGIEFPGWDPTTSFLIAEVELAEEPEWGIRLDALGIHSFGRLEEGGPVRVMVTEQHLGSHVVFLQLGRFACLADPVPKPPRVAPAEPERVPKPVPKKARLGQLGQPLACGSPGAPGSRVRPRP
jgi:2-polyprenyl-6-methoxyphenol hydroxylase-like FAD-dependent oxidoreductase